MGREVRKVSADWQHPKHADGKYIPLMEYMDKEINEDFYAKCGEEFPHTDDDYMPDFRDTGTHFMMYEDVSEGTPISPAFATKEELAHWLADKRTNVAKTTYTRIICVDSLIRDFMDGKISIVGPVLAHTEEEYNCALLGVCRYLGVNYFESSI